MSFLVQTSHATSQVPLISGYMDTIAGLMMESPALTTLSTNPNAVQIFTLIAVAHQAIHIFVN